MMTGSMFTRCAVCGATERHCTYTQEGWVCSKCLDKLCATCGHGRGWHFNDVGECYRCTCEKYVQKGGT